MVHLAIDKDTEQFFRNRHLILIRAGIQFTKLTSFIETIGHTFNAINLIADILCNIL
ncbi:hypothetical protein SDC9_170347 [bioreactor metagenome]|uniref:Uncharacterized protein n=1 Tax=bioreactor metagenome TaxID=1076179 RepID=A0A645GAG2_9ZZZZ